MTAAERRRLLEGVVASLADGPSSPSEAIEWQLKTFLPLRMHGLLLASSVIVVEGERGSGKTAAFQFFEALKAKGIEPRAVIPDAPSGELAWMAGFGTNQPHPATGAIKDWAQSTTDDAALERFWLGHLIGLLADQPGYSAPSLSFLATWRQDRNAVGRWVDELAPQVAEAFAWLDSVQVGAGQRAMIVGYDELDQLTVDGRLEMPARLSGALVRLWLGMRRRYPNLRAKIFLRPDLFQRVKASTVDASKLQGQVLPLRWTPEDVFRVLLRRLTAQDEVRSWLEASHHGLKSRLDPVLGPMPPDALPTEQLNLDLDLGLPAVDADVATQEAVAALLAGRMMGTGVKKGLTHRWILNHSRDGLGQYLPRVTLNLIRYAAAGALERGALAKPNDPLLSPSDLDAAQVPTGEQRIHELKEDHPVMGRLEALRGREVPLTYSTAAVLLGGGLQGEPDGHADGPAVIEQLVSLGAVVFRPPRTQQDERRVDVPDLFRLALGMKRKGGPLQLRNRMQ